ncbi:unnamed protein product [Rhizoctonia solani]|uniref:DUF7918 domain-containing protein n=1 Tax=Rhizoctonia solani TaxID=456999 RepID=A0A8H2X956_9AGAM|nr:unnamed protein product [Rhizoctonia solani]
MWKVLNLPRPDLDLFVYPYLDGVRMCGCSWTNEQATTGGIGELGHHPTGPSSFRLYEFGKRKMTDREDTFQTGRPRALIEELNTIKVRFAWGHQEAVAERAGFFHDPNEVAPILETESKLIQGLSDSVWLSQSNKSSGHSYTFCDFRRPEDEAQLKSTTFVFRYASRDWLQAQDIVARPPRVVKTYNPRIIPKRRRSITPDVIIVNTTEAQDDSNDDIIFLKHVVSSTAQKSNY